jgi:hypothetical protein
MYELKEEMTGELELRETRIFALEHTLRAQEQLVNNMRIEMDHLQGSMVSTAAGRRKGAEDMQEELVELTSTTQKQEREIKSLKMQVEHEKLAHEAEVTRLQETISSIEAPSTEHRDADDLKMELRLQAVKDRLEKLSWRNTSLKDENVALRDRLVKAEAQIQLKERDNDDVAQLQQLIGKQEKTIEELEAELMIKAPPSTIPGARSFVESSPSRSTSRTRASVESSPSRNTPSRTSSGTRGRLSGFLGRRSASQGR